MFTILFLFLLRVDLSVNMDRLEIKNSRISSISAQIWPGSTTSEWRLSLIISVLNLFARILGMMSYQYYQVTFIICQIWKTNTDTLQAAFLATRTQTEKSTLLIRTLGCPTQVRIIRTRSARLARFRIYFLQTQATIAVFFIFSFRLPGFQLFLKDLTTGYTVYTICL